MNYAMGKILGVVLLLATGFAVSLHGQQVLEDFENPGTWPWQPWTMAQTGTAAQKSTIAARTGTYGLLGNGGSWDYRPTPTVGGQAGHMMIAWVRPAGSGRTYLGFGATQTGSYSVVVANNTTNLIIQNNAGWGYVDVATSTAFTWNTAIWYRIELEWTTDTTMVASAFEGASTTPAISTTYTSTAPISGGFSLRMFGGHYLDDWEYVDVLGPRFVVDAKTGTRQRVENDDQGPGNDGLQVGEFDIDERNDEVGGGVRGIYIEVDATGNAQTAFSEISLYESSGGPAFDIGSDTLVQTLTTVPANNMLRFDLPAAQQSFAPSESRTYFLVVKLAGTATNGDTFDFIVDDLDYTGPNSGISGFPSDTMEGLIIVQAALHVTPLSSLPQAVWPDEEGPGGNGLQVVSFEIEEVEDLVGAELEGITIALTGTGNGQTAFTEVALYEAVGTSFVFGTDILVDSHAAFPTGANELTFDLPAAMQTFTPSEKRTYFLVVKLSGTATAGQVFNFRVQDLEVNTSITGKTGVPTSNMSGFFIRTPEFRFADESPAAPIEAFLGSTNNLVQQFTVEYPNGVDNKPSSFIFRAVGTGHDENDISAVNLWYDSDDDGVLDTNTDMLIDTGVYTADNGNIVMNLATLPNFQQGDTKRFFLTYDFNTSAQDGATFKSYVSGAGAPTQGGTVSGLPAPSSQGTAGIEINAAIMEFVFNGPVSAAPVDSNFTGAAGDGLLLYDVTVQAGGTADWTLNSLTFEASGTGDNQAAWAELALYEDGGNGLWDGSLSNTAASNQRPSDFGSSGQVTFDLNTTTVSPGSPRRFFLVGIFSGAAIGGDTFNAQLIDADYVPPTGGMAVGLPGAASSALVINNATLTIRNSSNQPVSVTHITGTAETYMLGRFVIEAVNASVDISQIVLTGDGNGDWAAWLDAADGVQIWLDNGDGVFDAATDTLLYSSGGSDVITAAFAPALHVPNATSVDLFIRVHLNDQAGAGAATGPATFQYSVASVGDVSATPAAAQVTFGTPAPETRTISMVEFFVTSVTPVRDHVDGGADITIVGSGFMTPLIVRIGGVSAVGTPVISNGTQVTGIRVPPGSGRDHEITIESGNLPIYTYPETFRYTTTTGGTGGGGGGGGGCAAGLPATPALAALLLPALAAIRRRKR
jgi:hypothetical protein